MFDMHGIAKFGANVFLFVLPVSFPNGMHEIKSLPMSNFAESYLVGAKSGLITIASGYCDQL